MDLWICGFMDGFMHAWIDHRFMDVSAHQSVKNQKG